MANQPTPGRRQQVAPGQRSTAAQAQRRPAPQPQQKAPQKVQQAPTPRKGLDVSELLDIVVRCGLDDEIIRIKKEDYEIFLFCWILGGEDIVLRARFEKHERNIVLRGGHNGVFDLREADPSRKIPLYTVHRARALYAKALASAPKKQASAAKPDAKE
jgi:hypothetical protein